MSGFSLAPAFGLGLASAPNVGGGGAPYVAQAVAFDPSTQLVNAAATAADTGLLSFSIWFKTPTLPVGEQYWFGVTQEDASTTPAVSFPSNGPGAQEVSVYSYSADLTYGYQAGNQFSTIEGAWHHMLFSGDMADPQAQQYLDDVAQRDLDPDFVLHSGFLPGGVMTINGRKWIFGGFDDPISFPREVAIEFADVWIAFGTSLLDGDGNIPEATRRKFIDADGKPADPSGFPAGSVLFTGNAAAFASNQGSAGAFAVTGSLTNASTSPSD
ncbi:hypothetical protein C8D77_11195 [Mesorhizobium loti]|uniref:Uncharacterized protein n=1 Tax=Rhizobium loti TaxID=381 RepID=A0A8E3B2R1_RHILI|nr:hypothetical protein [Mesorhizobium loti]PWJ88373.1 hypothetical protein C8D77_11195 [Mesorhizobium loti]